MGQSRHRDPICFVASARELLEDLAGDVALEGPDDLGFGASFGEAALHVGDGARFALAQPGEHDPPERMVRLAVPAGVEAAPLVGLAGAGRDGCDTAEMMDPEVVDKALSTLGKGMGPALIEKAKEMGVQLPAELNDPTAKLTPALIVPFLRGIAGHFFPLLAATPNDTD